jgi:hypothetical protein
MHGGTAMPTVPSPRVKVGGQFVTTATAPWTVAGCAFTPPSGNGPCVTAQFITFATRVMVDHAPVLLQDSTAVCVPTGTGLLILVTQVRVKGQ